MVFLLGMVVTTTMYYPDDLHRQIKKIAKKRGVPFATVVKWVLYEFIKTEDRPKNDRHHPAPSKRRAIS